MKAPIVIPTGCPVCAAASPAPPARSARGTRTASRCADTITLDVAVLAGVGFEVPQLVRSHGPEASR